MHGYEYTYIYIINKHQISYIVVYSFHPKICYFPRMKELKESIRLQPGFITGSMTMLEGPGRAEGHTSASSYHTSMRKGHVGFIWAVIKKKQKKQVPLVTSCYIPLEFKLNLVNLVYIISTFVDKP